MIRIKVSSSKKNVKVPYESQKTVSLQMIASKLHIMIASQ